MQHHPLSFQFHNFLNHFRFFFGSTPPKIKRSHWEMPFSMLLPICVLMLLCRQKKTSILRNFPNSSLTLSLIKQLLLVSRKTITGFFIPFSLSTLGFLLHHFGVPVLSRYSSDKIHNRLVAIILHNLLNSSSSSGCACSPSFISLMATFLPRYSPLYTTPNPSRPMSSNFVNSAGQNSTGFFI